MSEASKHILSQALLKLKAAGQFRTLKRQEDMGVDFTSNDYLGIQRQFEAYPFTVSMGGSGGSRLLKGNHSIHETVEAFSADWFKAEAALLFNSGYDANLAVLSTLPERRDTLLYDQRCHASLKDGIRLSMAQHKFPYQDLKELKTKLGSAEGRVYIVTEALFSMDGDWCPLQELLELAESRADTWVVLDESHSTGISGPQGSGYYTSVHPSVRMIARIHTFGKACGISGAVVVGAQELRDLLINKARPFIYTTAMPPFLAEAILYHLKATKEAETNRAMLQKNITFWGKISKTQTSSPIIPWIIAGNEACREVATRLQANGLDVRPILSPTVPKGEERLRIVLHNYNTEEEMKTLCEELLKERAQ